MPERSICRLVASGQNEKAISASAITAVRRSNASRATRYVPARAIIPQATAAKHNVNGLAPRPPITPAFK